MLVNAQNLTDIFYVTIQCLCLISLRFSVHVLVPSMPYAPLHLVSVVHLAELIVVGDLVDYFLVE